MKILSLREKLQGWEKTAKQEKGNLKAQLEKTLDSNEPQKDEVEIPKA